MTWKEAIATIDKSQDGFADIANFVNLFNINWYCSRWYDWCDRVKKYFVPGHTWICTDTQVGAAVYFMDDEVIAVSTQQARKCDEFIDFISLEAKEKVRKYIFEIMEKNNSTNNMLAATANLDECIDEWRSDDPRV